jgi:Alanine-zipper, major outer membrane lipoprotein
VRFIDVRTPAFGIIGGAMTHAEKLREHAKILRAQASQATTANEALVLGSRAAAFEAQAKAIEDSERYGKRLRPGG